VDSLDKCSKTPNIDSSRIARDSAIQNKQSSIGFNFQCSLFEAVQSTEEIFEYAFVEIEAL
ncbi:MAG: hypothetical protein B6D71_13015, partial [gamma proteobacterium symbiont of Stewartia floridana]